MICPQCNAWTRTLETRHKYDNEVYRRYECANKHRFSTIESVKLITRSVQSAGSLPRT